MQLFPTSAAPSFESFAKILWNPKKLFGVLSRSEYLNLKFATLIQFLLPVGR
jgi:hypothetical protein